MRESIGGTWLTGIVVTFLALFAGFLTYSISYTKAFRVKDNIVQIIEENEGYTFAASSKDNYIENVMNASLDDLEKNGSAEAEIFALIKKVGYNFATNIACDSSAIPGTEQYGYCVEKYCTNTANIDKVYYKITTYIALNIPVVNVTVRIPISGETNTLYHDSTGMENSNSDHNCYKRLDLGG